jgi:glutaconate CoA-transferase subunit A
MGVPYVPIVGLFGTDLLKRRDDMVVAVDPFDGKTKSVVAKALRPDIAVFHAQVADRHGNVSCGYESEAVILAEASRHVIVTAERIVDQLTEKEAKGAFIPGIHVDSVAHAPFGAHPGGCMGLYGPDKIHMREYVMASKDDASFEVYLQTYVHGVRDHDDYVERFVPIEMRHPTRAAGQS